MPTTLGLDIGTTSVGWCLMQDKKKIIDLGVRIFPIGVNEDTYNKSFVEESKNITRRNARSSRRVNYRYKLRRERLIKKMKELGMMPNEKLMYKMNAESLYALRKKAVYEKVTLQEIGRILYLLNQRRGFKSGKKEKSIDDSSDKELTEYYEKLSETEKKLKDSGCKTIGEYFYTLFKKAKKEKNWHNPDEPIERIRTQLVFRKLYEEEIDKIWETQQKFYPKILTEENKEEIKEKIIFYQRPLKSQKHLISKCRFEPNKRCAPKSSFEFQEFRMWQNINNLRVTDGERFRDNLTIDEKIKLANELQYLKELSQANIKKLLGFSRQARFGDIEDKLPGNHTYSQLCNALGKEYFEKIPSEDKFKIWNTLFFADDYEWLYNYALHKLKLSEEQSKNLLKVNIHYNQDYANLSIKAVRKILPYMKEGYDYYESCQKIYEETGNTNYNLSKTQEEKKSERELKEKITVNDKDAIRNPLVNKSINQAIKVVNAVIEQYGRPKRIKIEFARELKKPKNVREKIHSRSRNKNLLRDAYRKFLEDKLRRKVNAADIIKFELWLEMERKLDNYSEIDLKEFKKFSKNVNPNDKEKFRLWIECGGISPYTGKVINFSKLFSSEIEVEHIIPYSKSLDNSFINKTLCERKFNSIKGNKTAFQYFKERPDEKKYFLQRIKHFNDEKQRRFLLETVPDDFLNSQLPNTSYIANELRDRLFDVCDNIRITNGQATSVLRRFWGLNKILNPDGKNEKSRDDHRHHAIDALVIVNTEQRNIQQLSNETKFNYEGRLKNIEPIEIPYLNFFKDSNEKLSTALISYENKKRLITKRRNLYRYSKTKPKDRKNISIRGRLHEETNYGIIYNNKLKDELYVHRKPVEELTIPELEKIVDGEIKKIIKEHIDKHKGIGALKKEPVYIFSNDGLKKIQIKSVRIVNTDKNLEQLKPNENKKLYVSPGSNYKIAIYEDRDTGKRDFKTLTFYKAAINKLKKEPLFQKHLNGKELLYSLTHKDMVLVYDNHPDEINFDDRKELFKRLYQVVKFDVNGNIVLTIHNLSNVKSDKPKEYKLGIVLKKRFSTLKALKVRLDILGNIIKDD